MSSFTNVSWKLRGRGTGTYYETLASGIQTNGLGGVGLVVLGRGGLPDFKLFPRRIGVGIWEVDGV